jgi:cytochrome c
LGAALLATNAAVAGDLPFGRPALPAEIEAWDIDVRPDGVGLPPGQGTAAEGEEPYLAHCAACHGEFGEGAGRWPVLMGGHGTLTADRPEKTVGSYWPYTSTLWDYIFRAMPFGNAQSLSADEVYAIAAYVLYLNDVVELDQVLDQDNFALVELPNRDGFDIIGLPYAFDVPVPAEPCMRDCDVPTAIIGRAVILDVTPDQEGPGAAAID